MTNNTKTAHNLEIFRAIAGMNMEFKEGQGTEYLLRLALKCKQQTEEALVAAIWAAFTPTKAPTRRQSEWTGSVTGLQKALNGAMTFRNELPAWARRAGVDATQIWTEEGGLHPSLVGFCAGERVRSSLLRTWIGVGDALGLTPLEIGQALQEMFSAIDRIALVKPALYARAMR